MNRQEKGKQGEEAAVKYLEKNNYKILDKNFYTRSGEIDIVALDQNKKEMVFIEVKARGSNQFGYPEEAVDERKLRKMIKTAKIYTQAHPTKCYRFDCMAISMDYQTNLATIRHYHNIGLNF